MSQSAPITGLPSRQGSPVSRQQSPIIKDLARPQPPNPLRVGMKVLGYLAIPAAAAVGGYVARGMMDQRAQAQAKAARMAAQRAAYQKGQRQGQTAVPRQYRY